MLPHYPNPNSKAPHYARDYIISFVAFLSVTIALTYDGSAPLEHQKVLAVIAWGILLPMLWGESQLIRMQVLVAMAFATLGENFASLYMEGYIYRFKNIPMYIPAGHGIVYLTAVALGRSGLFQRYARQISILVIFIGGIWAVRGVSPFVERPDTIGLFLFIIFLSCLYKGRSPMVYLGAFFITSWLELVGTQAGTWAWVEIDPVTGLTQGNPPSGIAAWYCLVDAVAMGAAKPLLDYANRFYQHYLHNFVCKFQD
ncbi:MAG: hypothetical protein KAH08_03735 [Methylococcales bacterium]|nr:hypothetical protein [Methylococcales bacterium]